MLCPHPSDSCHLPPMARPPLGRVYGKAGLGWSELSSPPAPELVSGGQPGKGHPQQQEGVRAVG